MAFGISPQNTAPDEEVPESGVAQVPACWGNSRISDGRDLKLIQRANLVSIIDGLKVGRNCVGQRASTSRGSCKKN